MKQTETRRGSCHLGNRALHRNSNREVEELICGYSWNCTEEQREKGQKEKKLGRLPEGFPTRGDGGWDQAAVSRGDGSKK